VWTLKSNIIITGSHGVLVFCDFRSKHSGPMCNLQNRNFNRENISRSVGIISGLEFVFCEVQMGRLCKLRKAQMNIKYLVSPTYIHKTILCVLSLFSILLTYSCNLAIGDMMSPLMRLYPTPMMDGGCAVSPLQTCSPVGVGAPPVLYFVLSPQEGFYSPMPIQDVSL